MPPFQRAVLVLRAPLWEVSVVCVCVGFGEHPVTPRKGGSHSGQETQFCSSLSEDRKSVPLLPGSHPSPAGPIASAAGQWGHPVPQPQDRGSALSWLSPSGPALSWLLCPQPPVIAAYLLSCHRWTPRPLATNDYISQHPLCTMVTQPSSPSMPRPNMGGSPAPINSLGPGVHWAACSKKVFLMNALISTPDPLSHGARFICPGLGREMVTSVSREKIVHFYFLCNSFLNSFHSCGPTLASARTLPPQIGTLS